MTLEKDHQKLIEHFEEYKREYYRFSVEGKKVASTTSRKCLSEISKLTKEIRKGISEKKNSMSKKSKKKSKK